MNYRHAVAVAASVLLAVAGVVANAEPMKELAVYKASLGKWVCDAKETGSGKSFKAVAEFAVEFDGNTYVERYQEDENSRTFAIDVKEASGVKRVVEAMCTRKWSNY